MKRALLALVLLVLALSQGTAQAAAFAEKNLEQLVVEAEQIFVGNVSSLQSRRIQNGAIVTDVRFSDVQAIKGQGVGIVLLLLGGEVDGVRMEIPGVPRFQRGTRYLVFSRGNGKDMFPVVGGPAGLFRIMKDPGAGGAVVLTWSGVPLGRAIEAEVLAGAAEPGRGAVSPPVTLELFVAAIRAKLALHSGG